MVKVWQKQASCEGMKATLFALRLNELFSGWRVVAHMVAEAERLLSSMRAH
jgi:hypothetical protein